MMHYFQDALLLIRRGRFPLLVFFWARFGKALAKSGRYPEAEAALQEALGALDGCKMSGGVGVCGGGRLCSPPLWKL